MSFDYFAKALEEGGWTRQVAGDTDFTNAIDAVMTMFEYPTMGLLVSGEYGSGKTSLIKALVHRKQYKPFTVRLGLETDAGSLEPERLECDRPGWNEEWVFLDDLGSESRVNEYGIKREVVGEFITRWHTLVKKGGRLFITTNLTADALNERYGGRILDRLKQIVIPLRLTGESKREWTLPRKHDQNEATPKETKTKVTTP